MRHVQATIFTSFSTCTRDAVMCHIVQAGFRLIFPVRSDRNHCHKFISPNIIAYDLPNILNWTEISTLRRPCHNYDVFNYE